MGEIDKIVANAKEEFDLTNELHHKSLYHLTEELIKTETDPHHLLTRAAEAGTPLEFRIASHLVKSRQYLQNSNKAFKLGVVFAMWGEHHRLLPKSSTNPNGENTLQTKIDQLEWITRNTDVEWKLYAVDDGCPYDSGKIALDTIKDHPKRDQVEVMFLNDAIPTKSGPLRNLDSVDDSKKGGAIILGANKAIEDGMDAVMYTDADNSVHLGQVGILLQPHLDDHFNVVLGNRKDPLSVLVKQESRWGIGIKLLRHMQRMVGVSIFSRGILDSQAAFKLYESKILASVIEDPAVFDFSFDSDWIAAVIKQDIPLKKVPFAFVDSFAESASIVQGPMTTWERLLLGLVKSVRHRELPHHEEMAQVLEDEIKSSADLDILIHHLPEELSDVEDKKLGDPGIMSPSEIKNWITKRKSEEHLS